MNDIIIHFCFCFTERVNQSPSINQSPQFSPAIYNIPDNTMPNVTDSPAISLSSDSSIATDIPEAPDPLAPPAGHKRSKKASHKLSRYTDELLEELNDGSENVIRSSDEDDDLPSFM